MIVERQRTGVVRLIGALKLVKGLVLALVAIGLVAHADARALVWRLFGYVSERKLQAAGLASALYALVFVAEGVGLLALQSWAEWLTVIVTTSFIPLEIWKIAHHPTTPAIVTLVLNVVVVVYLAARIWHRRHHR